ncbi:MAG TPA: hypothetical protein VGO86_02685 [Candidatus Dormibacteraeota bacterium]|jgi:hypothetical protein
MKAFDRAFDAAAHRVLAWSGRHVEPSRAPWIDALRAELELVEGGGLARLLWALGGLMVVCNTRRSIVSRIWRSLPAALRFSLFGLALGVAGVIDIVWSNVIVPGHESDSEYQGLYLALFAGLLVYFAASGFVAARLGSSILAAIVTGLVTATVSIGIALLTFIVVDNLFLDVVMQQPDKAHGFAHSGLASARDYVNQGNVLGFVTAMPMAATIGACCGLVGGLLADGLGFRHAAAA